MKFEDTQRNILAHLFAQPTGQVVEGEDENENTEHDDADFLELAETHVGVEQEADSAGTNEAEDDGDADVDLKAIDEVADEHRHHLWHHGPAFGGQTPGSDSLQRFDRAGINAFDHFEEEFTEHADAVNRQRKHTGKRPDADGEDENECEDQRVDRTHEVEEETRKPLERNQQISIERGAALEVHGSEERQR